MLPTIKRGWWQVWCRSVLALLGGYVFPICALAGPTTSTVVRWGCWAMPYASPNTKYSKIAAGWLHNLGLTVDGTVVAWGWNGYGQCDVPAGLTGVVAIAAGLEHSLALKSDGTVVAWGWNDYGQCDVPAGLIGVVAIAAGAGHSLALKSDGTVVAWGRNDYGQCNVPAGLTGVVAIAGGTGHSLALKSDGTVVAWGWNDYGQCDVPAGLTGVVAIAAGGDFGLALVQTEAQVSREFQYPFEQSWPCTLGFGAGFYWAEQNKWYLGHLGEDYGAPEKTSVLAIADGEVAVAQPDPHPGQKIGWGSVVVLRHALPNGQVLYSQYGHLQQINVTAGAMVTRGQRIGTVGRTGNASGPHLHLEIKSSPTLGPGYAGTNFTGDSETLAGVTYYRPSLFIEHNRPINSSLTGYVLGTGGAGLRLRAEPSLSGRIIVVMPEGSTVTILDGVVYADGHTWRRVQYRSVTGWAAAQYLQFGQVPPTPSAPTGLAQWKSDGTTVLPAQGTALECDVVLGATVRGLNTETFKVQLELRSVGETFSVPTHQSIWAAGGETVKVQVRNLANGGYRWRARTINSSGGTSDWVWFGGGAATADFTVQYVAGPTAGIDFSPQLVFVGDTVQFWAQEAGQTGWSFKWEFSDGQTLTGGTTTRRFDTAGEYTARLVVTTAEGKQATDIVAFSVLTRELADAIDRLVDRTSTLLDGLVAEESEVADAADYFKAGVDQASARIVVNAILSGIGSALDYAQFKKWLELSLGEEFALLVLAELASQGADEVVDQLYKQQKSFRDLFVTRLKSYVAQKKTDLAQLRTEALIQARNLDVATAQSVAKELNARSAGNVGLSTIFDGRAHCPITFADLKRADENSWTYLSGEVLLNVSWGSAVLAASASAGPAMAVILPIVNDITEVVYSELSVLEEQSVDARMLGLTFGVLSDGIPFARRLFENTAIGLDLVKQGRAKPVVSGSIQVRDVARGHRLGFGRVNLDWIQEAYSEVTIVNTGSSGAEYRLDVSYPESFTTVQLFPFQLPYGIASRKYEILVLRAYSSVRLDPGQQNTVTIKYLTRQGGKIPKGNIMFTLTATTKENGTTDGMYLVGQEVRSFAPEFVKTVSGSGGDAWSLAVAANGPEGATPIMPGLVGKQNHEGSGLQAESLENAVMVEYPLQVRLLDLGSSVYKLQMCVVNPTECSMPALLEVTLPPDGIVLDGGGAVASGNALSWEVNLIGDGVAVLGVSYQSSQQSVTTNYPVATVVLYDLVNGQWVPFTEGTEPVILDLLLPPSFGRVQFAEDRCDIRVFGRLGAQYVLEASTNLVDWMPIAVSTCTNLPTVLVDSTVGNYSHRFYRLATQLTTIP
ncbi:MAG: peptidoglycan DD-metalloendopeptidase family protein [Verrucomicrobia bacterium]|nr:peptidoglycan DD-metalloendopeptidase family protein [Verrucomicrobiota bacterium]